MSVSYQLDELVRQRAEGINLSREAQQLLQQFSLIPAVESAYELLPTIYPDYANACTKLHLPINYRSLWCLHLPLGIYLAQQKMPFVLGIFGMQGTGKTTLTRLLQVILRQLGKGSIILSLDDLYKTYAERLELQKADPRIRWRGVPSTHDIHLGLELMENLQAQQYPLLVPRFDKALHNGQGDRAQPEIVTAPVDILLFEGWFVGVRPLPESAFSDLPPQDKQFAIDCNHQLSNYQKLWQYLDYLVALIPRDYHVSLQWRLQAEVKQRSQGKGAMSDLEVQAFVHYFWQALPPALFLPAVSQYADLVVPLDSDRQLIMY